MKRLSRSFISKILVPFSAAMFLTFNAFGGVFEGGDAAKGESLFKANCASCHKTSEEVLAAPGLKDIDVRWKGKDALIVKWIQNPQAAAATGDPYIKGLVDKYVPTFGWMAGQAVSEADIKDILTYVKTAADAAAPAGGAAGVNKCMTLEEIKAEKEKNEESDGTVWFIIIGSILAIIAVSAANISKSLKNAINEREGLPPVVEMSYWQSAKGWMWANRKFVSVIGLFLFCYFSVVGYKSLMDIGVYDGYTPDQPIWFSHAIHNCQNEIDCNYCHSSAVKSKHAGIPSVNVCMNCHKGIKKGAITGTAEIQKIYDAIGFDPATGSYIEGYDQKPIVWNKVNNLPDHVYFNHSTHVSVGKVDCKNCHGPQNMYTVGHVPTAEEINAQEDVVGLVKLEKRPFTMGWCLECHNKKEVDLAGSAYYQQMHERYKASEVGQRTLREIMEDGSATVRELGGWECGKCHY
ncbi:MAG: cytochrome c3 family protein [Flavobacteriales bacterium]|jgi:mono/diheme cytochrome c family protein